MPADLLTCLVAAFCCKFYLWEPPITCKYLFAGPITNLLHLTWRSKHPSYLKDVNMQVGQYFSTTKRKMKLIITAPLTFNELALHFQDRAALKLPFPWGQFPLVRMSFSTRISSDRVSVIEIKSCCWIWKESWPEFALLVRLHSEPCSFNERPI